MKGKRYSNKRVISVLKEHEAGKKVCDLVRKHAGSIVPGGLCATLALP